MYFFFLICTSLFNDDLDFLMFIFFIIFCMYVHTVYIIRKSNNTRNCHFLKDLRNVQVMIPDSYGSNPYVNVENVSRI